MKNIAAVTMVYNEPVFLPLWLNYYGGKLGFDNLFVIDHGSDDGSTSDLNGANRIALPRSPQDNEKRTAFVSSMVSNLLKYFDSVIYTDSDEFVVPDPRKFSGLRDFSSRRVFPVVTAVGLNVVQKRSIESDFRLEGGPVMSQRRFVRLCSPMTKPVVTSRPISWTPGFHGELEAPVFEDLFLFHLRYFDFRVGLERLERTRNQAWEKPTAGKHQRVDDEIWEKWFQQHERLPIVDSLFSEKGFRELEDFKSRFLSGAKRNRSDLYVFDHEVQDQVFEVPSVFSKIF